MLAQIIAGCIFIACRQANVPRTFREIFSLTRVPKKEINRVFKQLKTFLSKVSPEGASAAASSDVVVAQGSTSASDLCARYCSNLGFRNPVRIENTACALAKKAPSVTGLASRSPLSVAAACIYMASHLMGEPRKPREIAKVVGVSDGTIKTSYRFLHAARDRLIEREWLGSGRGNLDDLPAV